MLEISSPRPSHFANNGIVYSYVHDKGMLISTTRIGISYFWGEDNKKKISNSAKQFRNASFDHIEPLSFQKEQSIF